MDFGFFNRALLRHRNARAGLCGRCGAWMGPIKARKSFQVANATWWRVGQLADGSVEASLLPAAEIRRRRGEGEKHTHAVLCVRALGLFFLTTSLCANEFVHRAWPCSLAISLSLSKNSVLDGYSPVFLSLYCSIMARLPWSCSPPSAACSSHSSTTSSDSSRNTTTC